MVAIASVVRLAEPKVVQDNAARIVAWFAYVMANVGALYLHNTAIMMVVGAERRRDIVLVFSNDPNFSKRAMGRCGSRACWGRRQCGDPGPVCVLVAGGLPTSRCTRWRIFWLTVPDAGPIFATR